MANQSVKAKIVSGMYWNVVQLVVNRMFGIAIKLVLARLLLPEQFGIVGMAIVFISFVQVFNDLGIAAALVQKKEEHLREAHYHTAFWTGVCWSIALYLFIILAVAPIAALFYKEPILRQIIPFISLGVLSSPVNMVHNAQLNRSLNFKKLSIIGSSSNIFAGLLSLGLAFLGAGVWALAFNSIATIIIAMPMYFRATGWRPKLIWEKEAFKDIFGFGVYTTGTQLFNTIISKMDYLLIGKLLSASALGVYTLAFVLTDAFRSQLVGIIDKVMYPLYGQNQDNPATLRKFYLQVVKFNSLIICPLMVSFIALGEPIILTFFGNKWQDSILPLQILSLSVIVHMTVSSHSSLIRGYGKPALEMKLQLFKAIFLYLPFVFLGIYYYGIIGAAMAFLLNRIVETIIAQYYLNKLVNITYYDLFSSIKGPFLASILSYGFSLFLIKINVHFIFCFLGLALSYSGIIWLLMRVEILSQIREYRGMKRLKAI
jgi:O-antigen/teichoic acid export membrane protein